jgi:ABC-2 type transport system permease protein
MSSMDTDMQANDLGAGPPAGLSDRPIRSPGLVFSRLRWALLRNSFHALAAQPIRPITILLCSLVVWGFIFSVSYGGFEFLRQQGLELSGGVVSLLFDLMFAALAALLVFSSGIILYSSLFGAAETTFLLSLPVPGDQIFAHKYQGAVAFSSWAFVLLGSPVLIAYGLAYAAPWFFYALLPLFFVGFVLIPGSTGSLLCLLVVNLVPQRRKQLLIAALVLLTIPVVFWTYRTFAAMRYENLGRDAVERLLGRFRMAQSPLVPSHWIAWGLRAAARGEVSRSLYYLGLVWSNGLFAYLVAAWAARRLYRRGFNRLTTGGILRQRYGGHWLDTLLGRFLFFIDSQTRLLIVKDFRTFRRDPAQFAQVLIFGALMALYFINVRRLFVDEIGWAYQNGLSLLNLCATALLLCTYTGRFIFPMLSLEGRKFWVLGLLPLKRERLLWGKFVFSAAGGTLIATVLVLVSDLMLEMPPVVLGLHVLGVAVLATGLSGLSVGLGACMPNFRETDPSRIAVGFGGTLNLVVGLVYLVTVVGLMVAPWHVFAAAEEYGMSSPSILVQVVVAGGVLLGLFVGMLAVVLPLHYGARNLRRMEF